MSKNLSLLPSHKNGLVYLEHCRVVSSDTRLSYVRRDDSIDKHFSLPHGNLNVLLLGPGTSITQAAARLAAEHNLLFAFTAGGGAPIYMASLNEYRPTEYAQQWMKMWLSERRLNMAKQFQYLRVKFITEIYKKEHPELLKSIAPLCDTFQNNAARASSVSELLGFEGQFVKNFYGQVSRFYGVNNFRREHQEKKGVNGYITHGNYLAYGLAGVVLWIMGIPYNLPLSHGETRRGGLVFDVADLFKEAIVLPLAFEHFIADNKENVFRADLIDNFDKNNMITRIFEHIKREIHDSDIYL